MAGDGPKRQSRSHRLSSALRWIADDVCCRRALQLMTRSGTSLALRTSHSDNPDIASVGSYSKWRIIAFEVALNLFEL